MPAKIVMYSDPASEACRQAKQVLERHHLSWTELNAADGDAQVFLRRLCGAVVTPVFYVDDKWYPDPSHEELLHALKVKFDPASLITRGKTIYDVIVVGLGPAGLAAAHGCRLGGLTTLGIDESEPGGHLLNLSDVEEYIGVGYDDSISGRDVADNFAEHARHVGATLTQGKVTAIRIEGGFKQVTAGRDVFYSRAVIVATGAGQRELACDGIAKLLNKGVRYGAQVDAGAYAGKRVIVVGGGDEAFHAAIFLAQHAKNVMMLIPEDAPTAEPILVERALALKVRTLMGITVAAVQGGQNLENVFFREKGIDEEQGLPCDAMVVALGNAPRKPIPGLERLPLDGGYFAHGEGGKTMFPGVYVAGDCAPQPMRTLMGVVASGNMCARRVWQWLAAHPLPKLKF